MLLRHEHAVGRVDRPDVHTHTFTAVGRLDHPDGADGRLALRWARQLVDEEHVPSEREIGESFVT